MATVPPITPWVPGFKPLTTATPFVFNGYTFLELYDELKRYLTLVLTPDLDERLKFIYDETQREVNELTTHVNTTFEQWQELFDLFMDNVIAELEALNDQAVTNLVNNPTSQTAIALSALIELKTNGKFVPINDNRVKIGVDALSKIPENYTRASSVVAIGKEAMSEAVAMKTGIAIGNRAMKNGTMSRDNIAIGDDALFNVQGETPDYDQSRPSGTRNIAIGGNAGRSIVDGRSHVAIGRNAGQAVVGTQGMTAVGSGAMSSYMPIGFSGEIENWAPVGGEGYNDITALGYVALNVNSGSKNTAVGSRVLNNNTVGTRNVAMGDLSLTRLGQGTWIDGRKETVSGASGTYTQTGNDLVINIVAHGLVPGDTALLRLTGGESATFQGDSAPAVVVSAPSANSFLVRHPVARSTSGTATLVSYASGPIDRAAAVGNVAIGSTVAPFLIEGRVNTFVGTDSGFNITGGTSNTGVGGETLKRSTPGASDNNTAVGYGALRASDGNSNTSVGSLSGLELVTGDYNTFVGYNAGHRKPDGDTMTSATNVTCVGYNSRADGDNQMQLGNSDTNVYVYSPVQVRSDVRDKTDIENTALGLDFISMLRPVDYRLDPRENYDGYTSDGSKAGTRKHHGLIAQEVRDVANVLGVDFAGHQDHSVNGGGDVQSIAYEELIAPLIKSVQELKARIEELEK